MQSLVPTNEMLNKYYITAIDALYELAHSYFFLGRLKDALHVLSLSLQIIEVDEVAQKDRLKLLLLHGRVLVVDHVLTHENAALMFATIQQAKQIAEALHDQRDLAEALSLLGQAHYFALVGANLAVVTASLRGEPLPEGFREQFNDALSYQQRALEMREALHDTQGMSESLFQIGSVYERWQEYEQAQEYYTRALQIADQHGHLFEKVEPTRHLALSALVRGDLEQALASALQALSFREEVGFMPYLPLDHLLLRDIYLAKGDVAKAGVHTQKVSALAGESRRLLANARFLEGS